MLQINMPQSAVQLGKQATPSASRAMPATRATGLATPARSAPSNNLPTNEGKTIRATPVAASAVAARENAFHLQKAATRWITQNIAIEPMV